MMHIAIWHEFWEFVEAVKLIEAFKAGHSNYDLMFVDKDIV